MATKAKKKAAKPKGEKKKGSLLKKLLFLFAGLLIAGGSAAGVIFFFYQDGMPLEEEGTPPVVEADDDPFKVRPENPEGMEFAHRDSAAYDAIENPDGAMDDGVISIQDPPELPTSPAFDDDLSADLDNPYSDEGELPPEALALLGGGEPPLEPLDPLSPEAMAMSVGEAAMEPEAEPMIPPSADEVLQQTEPMQTEMAEVEADMAESEPMMAETMETASEVMAASEPAPESVAAPAEPTTEAMIAEMAASEPTMAPEAQKIREAVLTKAVRIQLGSLRSKAVAEREWKRLAGRHGDLLGTLALHVEQADLGSRGTFYRVQAGPLETAEAARALCQQLEGRNVGCLIVRP